MAGETTTPKERPSWIISPTIQRNGLIPMETATEITNRWGDPSGYPQIPTQWQDSFDEQGQPINIATLPFHQYPTHGEILTRRRETKHLSDPN